MLRRSRLTLSERAAATDLVYGSLRMRGALDFALAPLSRQPLERLEPLVLRGLRLGAYELLFGGTAAHAAVAETVGAVARAGHRGQAGYVNAVLRRLAATPPVWPDPERDPAGWATTRGSHPAWIVEEALARLGPRGAGRPGRGGQHPARGQPAGHPRPDHPRRAAGRAGRGRRDRPAEPAQPRLRGHGAGRPGPPGRRRARAGRWSRTPPRPWSPPPSAPPPASWWPTWPPGRAARPATWPPSAPGSWPSRSSGAGPGWSPRRPAGSGWPTGCTRWSPTADSPPLRPGAADAVLVDAPCTNLGSLRRRPEARWRHGPGDIAGLVDLQLALLEAAAEAVRAGGTVLYSVCTWTQAETEEVVAELLERRGDLRLEEARQLWPHRDGADGMFLARLRKVR